MSQVKKRSLIKVHRKNKGKRRKKKAGTNATGSSSSSSEDDMDGSGAFSGLRDDTMVSDVTDNLGR